MSGINNKNISTRQKRRFRIIGAGSDLGILTKKIDVSKPTNNETNSIASFMKDDIVVGLKTVLENSVINYKTDITGFIPLPLPTTNVSYKNKSRTMKRTKNVINDEKKNMLKFAVINPTNNRETKEIHENINVSKDIPLKALPSIFDQYISSAKNTREQWNILLGDALNWKGSRVYTKTTSDGDKIYVSYNSDPPTSESNIVLTSGTTYNSFKFSKNIDPSDPNREVYLNVQATCTLNQNLSETGNVLFQNTNITNNLNINSQSGFNGLVIKNGSETPISLQPNGEVVLGSGIVKGKLIIGNNSVTGITTNIPLGGGTTDYLLPSQKAVADYASTIGTVGPQGLMGLMSDTGAMGPQGFQGVSITGLWGANGQMGTTGSNLIGSIGPQGAQGSNTIRGPQGDIGYDGATGLMGLSGQTGFEGISGSIGARGPQGFQGDIGLDGNIGMRGFQGLRGATGPAGIQGSQGIMGPQGPQGDTVIGPDGFMGVQGNDGLRGFQGIQGTRGIQGPIGYRGFQGPQGNSIRGVQGSHGVVGSQGFAGYRGNTGPIGVFGYQGVQGSQGLITSGVRGFQGFQGRMGSIISKQSITLLAFTVFGKNSHGLSIFKNLSVSQFASTVISWGFAGPNHVAIDINFTYSPVDPDSDPITGVYFGTSSLYFPFPDLSPFGSSYYFVGNNFIRYAKLNNSANPRPCFICISQSDSSNPNRGNAATFIDIHKTTPSDGFDMALGDNLIFEHVNIYFTCTG